MFFKRVESLVIFKNKRNGIRKPKKQVKKYDPIVKVYTNATECAYLANNVLNLPIKFMK